MTEEDFVDHLAQRRRYLMECAKKARTPEEIKAKLSPYKKTIDILIDDKECTITYSFEAVISDPNNNKKPYRKEASLSVTGNLFRPIEDFDFDVRWLMAQARSISEAQRGIISRG